MEIRGDKGVDRNNKTTFTFLQFISNTANNCGVSKCSIKLIFVLHFIL